MKKQFTHTLILLLSFVALSSFAQQQKVEYTYDYAGNRICRKVVPLTLNQVKKHNDTTPPPAPVEEKLGERTIKVYPNPTKGALAIEIMGGNEKERIQLLVISAQGTRLQTLEAKLGTTPLDMRPYPSGWYILRIVAGVEIKEIKIVKQ